MSEGILADPDELRTHARAIAGHADAVDAVSADIRLIGQQVEGALPGGSSLSQYLQASFRDGFGTLVDATKGAAGGVRDIGTGVEQASLNYLQAENASMVDSPAPVDLSGNGGGKGAPAPVDETPKGPVR